MSKLVEYVGFFHILKERIRESWTQCWSSASNDDGSSANDNVREVNINFRARLNQKLERLKLGTSQGIDQSPGTPGSAPKLSNHTDFSHVYRTKTSLELLKISAAVMGIEFAYAAETAFVSPLLLNMGLRHRNLSLIWFLSPLLGLFITPILGSLSDGCRLQLGRRRPFIILLSVGIILGLLLVPNGKLIGTWLGDTYGEIESVSSTNLVQKAYDNDNENVSETIQSAKFGDKIYPWNSGLKKSEALKTPLFESKSHRTIPESKSRNGLKEEMQISGQEAWTKLNNMHSVKLERDLQEAIVSNNSDGEDNEINASNLIDNGDPSEDSGFQNSWGLIFTVLGTVLLDFDADACQSPSRAFMLDITMPEDHARGLSSFTIMAGLGGSIGYFLGAIDWENTFIGDVFGGHVRAVFTLVLFIFIGCVATTLSSFPEIPIDRLWTSSRKVNKADRSYARFDENDANHGNTPGNAELQETTFNVVNESREHSAKVTSPIRSSADSINLALQAEPYDENATEPEMPTFAEYVKTIIQLPRSLQWLCLTNFFSWISLVCFSLYFTDFVGEVVFAGDPAKPSGTKLRIRYDSGVRFGCIGMSLYSLACAIYSFQIQTLVQKFGSRKVYICGQFVYSLGMICMALFPHPVCVILFSWTAGIMYATLFTMPYLLVARYHAADTFSMCPDGNGNTQKRGLGTDVAVVSSMVFLAQMTQALTLGTVVAIAGTNTATVWSAAFLASCGALSATKVLYLDL